jgi:hypothetical protein
MPTQSRRAPGWRLFCLLIIALLAATPLWPSCRPAAALAGPVMALSRTQADPVVVTQQAYIKASNANSLDTFGRPLAIDGDTLVVSAPAEASAATGVNGDQSNNAAYLAGAVYVFVRSNGAWSQQAYLKASNSQGYDFFGTSIALSGDTLVVGATGEASAATGIDGDGADNSAENAGAVYVFVRSNGVWSQQAYLKASNTDAGDKFGSSVAIDGNTVVVGAPWEDSAATGVDGDSSDNSAAGAGAAYVFVRNGGVWTQQSYLKASNTEPLYTFIDTFGQTVALSGDTVVVGAPGEDSNATGVDGDQDDNSVQESGAAYVFTRTAGAWSQQAYLKASNTDHGDEFGVMLDLAGDLLVVGAPLEDSAATGSDGDQADNSAEDAGAAYVFVRSDGVWSQQIYLKASNSEAGDRFSAALAVDADRLVVSAPGEDSAATGVDGNQADNSAQSAGAAYLFGFRDGVWLQSAYLKASNSEADDLFSSVALHDRSIAIGAPGEASIARGVDGDQSNNQGLIVGAAYVFQLLPTPPPITAVPCRSNVYPIVLDRLALEAYPQRWYKPVTMESIGLSLDADNAQIPSLNTLNNKSPRFRVVSNAQNTLPNRFYWVRWNSSVLTESQDLLAMLSGAGTLADGFSEYGPPVEDPAAIPLVNGMLEAGDWVAWYQFTPSNADIQAALDAHIAQKTRLILPVYDTILGSANSQLVFFHVQRFVEVRLLSYDLAGAYLEFALIDADKTCLASSFAYLPSISIVR